MDILCLQETKIATTKEVMDGTNYFVYLSNTTTKIEQYGLGFAISKKWINHVIRYKIITNRIAVLQLKSTKNKIITIINVYAPTMTHTNKEKETFYKDLGKYYPIYEKQSSFVFICGDFNAKVGKKINGINEEFLGPHGRGYRNKNGNLLTKFCEKNDLYISNTKFPHKARHITTVTNWKITSPTSINT